MRPYLYSLICAGIICALIGAVFHANDCVGKIIRMMSGLFMLLVVLAPVKKINLTKLDFWDTLQTGKSQQIISQGQIQAEEALREVIQEHCTTYIVEKAKGMGVDIDVQFQLNDSNPPVPYSATVTGAVTPYAKARLKEILTHELGIPEDQQKWN